jgi:hypothetical protein
MTQPQTTLQGWPASSISQPSWLDIRYTVLNTGYQKENEFGDMLVPQKQANVDKIQVSEMQCGVVLIPPTGCTT